MKLLLFRDVIRKFRNRRGVKGLRRLYSRREIDALMHRERARADRSGLRFALAVFQVSSMTLDPSVGLRRLARTLSRRARATDHVGRFDAERLCVILPETSAEGARSFAQDIRQLTTGCPAIPLGPSADEIRLEKLTVTNTADSLCCEVFSYPSEIVLDEGNSSLRRPEE